MSAAFGPERPIISAAAAERWAETEGLRLPELVADEAPAGPVLGADELHDWQQADGWFDDEVDELEEFFASVFHGFEEFEQEMRSKQLGLRDDGSDLVARATGWAERRGPYCEWVLELRAMDDGRFLALGGPPGRVRVWRFRREFDRLVVAARWMHSAAESLGTMADASSAWRKRWPE